MSIRASHEVEKRTRTLRPWFEGVSVDRVCKVLPDTVRICAWQMTHRHVRTDGRKQIERPRGRPHSGQVSEFAELNHFRDPQKAGDTSKLYGRRSRRLWKSTIVVSSATIRRCRPIWRRPENQRWDRKLLTESEWRTVGNTTAAGGEASDTRRGVPCPETTDQVWWQERLHGVLQTRRRIFSGVTITVRGHRKQ